METLHYPCANILHKFVSCLLAFLMVNVPIWALNVDDATLAAGSATKSQAGNTVSIDLLSNRAVFDWTQMNANSSETLKFTGADGFAVLNRVASAVDFNGALNGAGGNIYIVSPYGINIGSQAVITAKSFTASGLNISNIDFMDGIDKFVPFQGGMVGDVINSATIDGVTDQVNLIGKQVVNDGVISMPAGGVVLMAAGDNVQLGTPGGKVVVEMSGIDGGLVKNSGKIESPNGKIILAAGDIYSIPLHPHAKVGTIPDGDLDYSNPADKAIIDAQPVRVETGKGSVQQLGEIAANGANGSVILTAGDTVVFGATSKTSAVNGSMTASANDFGNFDTQTLFNQGAVVNIGTGEAEFYGNNLLYGGTVNAQACSTLHIGSQELTIADVLSGTPAMDTVYEEMVEIFSNQGVNLDLAGDLQITVDYMADGKISGGNGDITLRNVFEDGGILFLANASGLRTAINTTAAFENGTGGGIYMLGGSGGIISGYLLTDTLAPDKISQPGEILLLTTNGGDIEVFASPDSEKISMKAYGANSTQVSAVASGDLIVHGSALSLNKQVDNSDQAVSKAILCLIAGGDITLKGQEYGVLSHGKTETTADVRISAGKNVTIGSASSAATISAEAKTSEKKDVSKSTASVLIYAGTTQDTPGQININGVTYVPGQAYLSNGKIYAKAWPDLQQGVDSSNTPSSTSGTETKWQDKLSDNFVVRLDINSNASEPCTGCPTPPGLPPVPHVFWLVNDEFQTNWRSGNVDGFGPETLDVLANDGLKSDPTTTLVIETFITAKGGILELVQVQDQNTGEVYWAFNYTPPTDQPFVWDGSSEYATFSDTFTYQAEKMINGKMVLSKNEATVEIAVTNFLPTLAEGSETIHMSTGSNPTSANFDLSSMVVDIDGTPGTVNYGVIEGLIPVADGFIATDAGIIPDTLTMDGEVITYSPLDGYVSPDEDPTTFGYSVVDSSIVNADLTAVQQTADIEVTVTNELPGGEVVLEDAHMNAGILGNPAQTLGVNADESEGFSDEDGDEILETVITPASDDYNRSYGGELVDMGDDTYEYTTDDRLPGYTGEDNFDAQIWDGQREYFADGSSDKVYGNGYIYLNIENELPSGDVWLGTVDMDTPINNGSIVSGSFDDDGDTLQAIEIIGVSSDDYNQNFGGQLAYNMEDETFDYTPDTTTLPGYVGDNVDDFDADGYDISANADDRFIVQLWDGEYDYSEFDFEAEPGTKPINLPKVYGEGTVSVDIVNELPTVNDSTTTVHMNTDINKQLAASDSVHELTILGQDPVSNLGVNVNITKNSDGSYTWNYESLDGYVGDDSFSFSVTDGQRDYVFGDGQIVSSELVSVSGKVSIQLTNAKPTANGDLGSHTAIPDPINQNGTTSPVKVTDGIDLNQVNPDDLSIVSGTYTGNHGGTLKFADGKWTYTPAEGFTGTEEFAIDVWDGQNIYEGGELIGPDYGQGTVSITLGTTPEPEPEPILPTPALADLVVPEIKGCPALMDAAASELSINTDDLQVMFNSAMASNPNLQPCDACEKIVDASNVLKDTDGLRMAALAQIFNTLAPADAPFTPEVQASVAAAFADMAETDPQYAMAVDYIDSFVNYVAVLQQDLKMPLGDPMAVVIEKYGQQVVSSDNPNIAAYIMAQLSSAEVSGEGAM